MDRVEKVEKALVQLGDPGTSPEDILARKDIRVPSEWGGVSFLSGMVYDYPIFNFNAREIHFDLSGVGGSPTALARMMLCWSHFSEWTPIHARIDNVLGEMFDSYGGIADMFNSMENVPYHSRKIIIAIQVLDGVHDEIPSKQKLVADILGEFLGATSVSSSDKPFSRKCIFGDNLRLSSLEDDYIEVKGRFPAIEKVNAKYNEEVRKTALKTVRKDVVLTFLKRFVRCNDDELRMTSIRMISITIWNLRQYAEKWPRYCLFDDQQTQTRFINALTKGCYDEDGICGICWVSQQPADITLSNINCIAHKKPESISLKSPKSITLSGYLKFFAGCSNEEVIQLFTRIPEISFVSLWAYLSDRRQGKALNFILFENQETERRVSNAVFEGCSDVFGNCGNCYLARQNHQVCLGMEFKCPVHGALVQQIPVKEPMDIEKPVNLVVNPKPLQKEASADENSKQASLECVICFDRVNCVFIPCGHPCCCMECGRNVRDCPICRAAITMRHKIYL
jgi:hypothetical protein